MQKNKIGVGLITCDRQDFFTKAIKSLINALEDYPYHELIVVNDGLTAIHSEDYHVVNTGGKIGVGRAKNVALNYLLNKNRKCEHIFLMEDDIEISDPYVFKEYIKTASVTGIKHLNYALHGNHNRDNYGNALVRKTVNYPDNTKVDLYPNLLGAFSYFHNSCLDEIGLIDPDYYNAMEHVDHTYRAIKAAYHPPFRWFADVHGSDKMLKDIVPDHQQSKIRNEANFQETFKKGVDLFIEKQGFSVIGGYGPPEKHYTEEECLKSLQDIWKKRKSE
jgi:glycosyltransferase involved in cell wall biosynthesis